MADTYFGTMMSEQKLKDGLRSLNPDVHFDLGAAHNLWHPRIAEWQGIYVNGRHLGTMDRGLIPEWTISVRDSDGEAYMVSRVGWRETLQALSQRSVPGFTWPNFCRVFGIDYMKYNGSQSELQVTQPPMSMR